jgi:hypothetical protein
MKTKVILSLILLCSMCTFADELQTPQNAPILVAYADANAAALTVSTSSWSVTKNWPIIPSTANGVKICFYAYDPNNPDGETFSYDLYVADYGCNAQKVASGTATIGKAQLSHNPVTVVELNSGAVDPNYCWVDTLGTITSDWKTTVAPQNDGGVNDVASFIFDRQCARKIYCRIYSRSNAYLKVWCVAYGY